MEKNHKPLSIRHERFCENVAGGMSGTQAYQKAGYKVSAEVAAPNANRLLKNAKIKSKISQLRAKTATKQEFKRDDMVGILVHAVKAPFGKNNKASDKLGAARLLVEVMGWKEPETRIIETGAKTLESIAARAARVCSALDAWTNRKK